MKKRKGLKPGTIVVATCVITDRDEHDNHYIHAIPGTLGVVLSDDADEDGLVDPKWPNICWGLKGEGGTCNVTPDEYKLYKGRVQCAID